MLEPSKNQTSHRTRALNSNYLAATDYLATLHRNGVHLGITCAGDILSQ